MSRCVLGTDEITPYNPLPCKMCIRQSMISYAGAEKRWFGFQRDNALAAALQTISLDELIRWEQPLPDGSGMFPLGRIILTSLRWRLRLHSLSDDEPTRFLCREFMLSA